MHTLKCVGPLFKGTHTDTHTGERRDTKDTKKKYHCHWIWYHLWNQQRKNLTSLIVQKRRWHCDEFPPKRTSDLYTHMHSLWSRKIIIIVIFDDFFTSYSLCRTLCGRHRDRRLVGGEKTIILFDLAVSFARGVHQAIKSLQCSHRCFFIHRFQLPFFIRFRCARGCEFLYVQSAYMLYEFAIKSM